MTELTKGANIALDAGQVRAAVTWSPGSGVPDVDASALLLGADGRVTSDADFVFYNQPVHPGGAVRHAGKADGTDSIDVDLAALAPSVDRVILAASAASGTFGDVPGLRLVVADAAGSTLAEFAVAATTETALVGGELYRRGDGWKFRAVGQGYASGLAGLATDFGIDVGGGDPAPVPTAAPTAPTSPAAPPPLPPQPPATPPPLPAPAAAPPPLPPPPPADDTSLDLEQPFTPPPSYTGTFPTAPPRR